jgi:hypothetical protein
MIHVTWCFIFRTNFPTNINSFCIRILQTLIYISAVSILIFIENLFSRSYSDDGMGAASWNFRSFSLWKFNIVGIKSHEMTQTIDLGFKFCFSTLRYQNKASYRINICFVFPEPYFIRDCKLLSCSRLGVSSTRHVLNKSSDFNCPSYQHHGHERHFPCTF